MPQNPLSKSPTAFPLFYRSYSRRTPTGRETLEEAAERAVKGLNEIDRLPIPVKERIKNLLKRAIVFPSGRWMWVGGTDHVKEPENYYSAYNCSSRFLSDWEDFGILMDLSMQGCGTGSIVEKNCITTLPSIINKLEVELFGQPGDLPKQDRLEDTRIGYNHTQRHVTIHVGDSRKGWVDAYVAILTIASSTDFTPSDTPITVNVCLSNVRPKGERLVGFGGIANPVKLSAMFTRLASILNGATGRRLNAREVCQIQGEAGLVVVAGNIRRSASMRQGSVYDPSFTKSKDNLWVQSSDGKWSIDPERDALRMANHTVVYHDKPTLEQCIDSVTSQFYSGEGAIQWSREAIARANCDVLNEADRHMFLNLPADKAAIFLRERYADDCATTHTPFSNSEIAHRLKRYGLNPCAEVIGADFLCNLSEVHLNQIDPNDFYLQQEAFEHAAIAASVLLHHEFDDTRFAYSRDIDPIIQVSFTGLFDFFVKAFGVPWLLWWKAGRAKDWGYVEQYQPGLLKEPIQRLHTADTFLEKEAGYLKSWRIIVERAVWEYCEAHGLRTPNRCTGVQPAGSKSLLTNASPGWHPPKAVRCIRRITFAKNDPIALACIDYGYSVVPAQSDKDENGNLLNDPFDPRCTEWLVEIPIQVDWADLADKAKVDPNQFSALAQMDFYMQVQKHYTRHNCFSRDTAFLTSEGVRTFEDFEPGDKVSVLNKDGEWAIATIVRTEDLRVMYEIKLREGKTGKEKTIIATGCHRFPTRRASCGNSAIKVLTTGQLKPGHRLVTNTADLPHQWRVVSVTELSELQYGWCVMEPETEHFTLTDNILVMNTSATIELREHEILPLADRIYRAIKDDEGYISVALLSRSDDFESYPRLPFEPVSKDRYEELMSQTLSRRKSNSFHELLAARDGGTDFVSAEQGAAPCDSDKCLMPEPRS